MRIHRTRQHHGMWLGRLLAAALFSLVAPRSGAATAELAPNVPRWQSTLQEYARDPAARGSRRALLEIATSGMDGLPPVYRLAVADAYLRAGDLRKASQAFDEIIAADAGEPWSGLAGIGRGWTAVRAGDLGEARGVFADASDSPGSTGLLGDFMVGLIDAGNGHGSEALERFARVTEHPDATEELRLSALMAEGYARFWIGDDTGAQAVFARIMQRADHPLADDARYAAALSRWRQGDLGIATEMLEGLAESDGERSRALSSGLARLDPRAMVRASTRQYRRLPLRMPAEQVISLLDIDAPAVARVALRRLESGAAPPPPVSPRTVAADSSSRANVDGWSVVAAASESPSHADHTHPAAAGAGLPWDGMVFLTLGALAVLWLAARSPGSVARR